MPPPRVLVVEDEDALVQLAELYLSREGFEPVIARTGEAALEALAAPGEGGYAVALLDIGLPGAVDGIEVCRRMRAADDWTPVVFVTARDDEVDRVLGLELGADDYVTKPYSPRELVARVRALHRRHQRALGPRPDDQHERLVLDGVTVELDSRRVLVGDDEILLTATEFDLLAHLVARPGRVLSRAQLLEAVWGYPAGDVSRTVDVHVAQLRAKLGPACPIRTVRGVGYAAGGTPR